MDRQMERGLFGNDIAIQEVAAGTSQERCRSVASSAGELENKRTPENKSKGGAITIEGLRDILIQQGYRCALSGVVISPDNAQLDHMVPLSKGGSHTLDNVQIVHEIANSIKGQMNNEEFIRWAQLIASNARHETDGDW